MIHVKILCEKSERNIVKFQKISISLADKSEKLKI